MSFQTSLFLSRPLLALTLTALCLLGSLTPLSAAGSPPRPARAWQAQPALPPEHIGCPTSGFCPRPVRQPGFQPARSLPSPRIVR